MKYYITTILLLFFFISISAQTERETRAVWVTTNYQLDWPPKTTDPKVQKDELIKIINDIDRQKLNTIYFQVRSNGTVFFNSEYEPYSPYLTGITGVKPDYDPLEFAINAAHKKGLEIHAWLNVVRCFGGTEEEILSHPDHLYQKHPDWLMKVNDNGKTMYWLDPGLPEVRNYLIDIILDMVYNYDIDGLHLDFIRYPHVPFNDEFSYNLYGNGQSIQEFRRSNITKFLEVLRINIKEIKPDLKVGVTPLGIYTNIPGAVGLEAFHDVYQASRDWLKKDLVDYAVPQIYWDLAENPKFEQLAKDWVANSHNKNMILGIAAYKPEVADEMEELIKVSRNTGSDGVAFFRYAFIKNKRFSSFQNKTYPSILPWMKVNPPLPPENLTYKIVEKGELLIQLNWDLPFDVSTNNEAAYYALYKMDNANDTLGATNLYEIFSADKKSIVLKIDNPKQLKYYFALKSADKHWNESISSSDIIEVTVPSYELLKNLSTPFNKPILISESKTNFKLIIFSEEDSPIHVFAENSLGKNLILKNQLNEGINIFSIKNDLSDFNNLRISFGNQKEVELKL